jgi:hypothetical protein
MESILIPQDKANHFVYGVVIAAVLCLLSVPVLWSFGAVVGVAAAKEVVHDWLMKRGTPDVLDFFWTVAGGFAVVVNLLF